MASNYSAKGMEKRNKPKAVHASTGGKVAIYLSFIFIVPAIWFVKSRNKIIKMNIKTMQVHQSIDVILTKRANALAAVFQSTKKYFKHEKELLENVTKARGQANRPTASDKGMDISAKDAVLVAGTRAFNMIREQYPELKAMQAVKEFDKVVLGIEDELANTRRFYNSAVLKFNTMIQQFPSNVPAASIIDPETNQGLMTYPMFEAQDEDRKNPLKDKDGKQLSFD
ncbi:MAG: LemA family protein [Mycoplasmataceae bacterium]|nr:LemA family protein [Mycoplasmataceae bacterium]